MQNRFIHNLPHFTRLFKPILSLALSIALSLALFPVRAPANQQNPVTSLTLSCMPGGAGANAYTVRLRWTRPAVSAKPDAAALPEYASAPHPNADAHQNYAVYLRNATRFESFAASAPVRTIADNDAPELEDTSDYTLDGGSLYEYRITPYHTHKYSVRMPNGSYVTVDGTAPLDASAPEARGYLLTDIGVTARGSGSSLTVSWDNPTLDGAPVFSGYRIYYILGGSKAGFIPLESYRTVLAGDPGLSSGNGRLTYTITDAGLEMGKPYAVKVEPLINGGLARNLTAVTINGARRSFTYRSLTTDEYRTNDAYVSPSLAATPEGLGFVRLTWSNISASIQNIDRVEIFSANTADFETNSLLNPALLGTLSGADASRSINYWLTARPAAVMYYQARIYYTDVMTGLPASMDSDVAVFDPTHTDFTPYKPSIESITDGGAPSYPLTVTWDAFARMPYNAQETDEAGADFGGAYVDRNVEYTVYVTDDIRNFDGALGGAAPNAVLPAASLSVSSVTMANGGKKPVYTYTFTDYWQKNADGTLERKPLESNKFYYVRITARRILANGQPGQESAPATGAHFIPPSGAVPTNPNMISRPPLRVKKDALGADMVTENSVAIQWDTRYYEIYNPADDNWYTVVGVAEDGSLAFGKAADGLGLRRAVRLSDAAYTDAASETQGQALIRADLAVLDGLAAETAGLEEYPLRLIDLTGCQYEIHAVRYDYMARSGGYEAYMAMLISPGNEDLWRTIAPVGSPERPEYEVTSEDAPTGGLLAENTAYVVYFRPYITSGGVKAAYFPSYVMATTLSPRAPMAVTPTVPMPEPVSAADTSVTLRWRYSPELGYDLRWADALSAYPGGGTAASPDAFSGAAKTDGEYIYYTVTGLFPETQYHLWIRAKAADGGGFSGWSNPISMTTSAILPPAPPEGLGPVSRAHMDSYNQVSDADLRAVAENYLAVEWMRDPLDAGEAPAAGARPADGAAGAEILSLPDAEGMYAALFTGLTANKAYYIRAKTVLTVTRSGGGAAREYAYVVQAADNPGFAGAIEITIPALADTRASGPAGAKRSESAWCAPVRIYTAKTAGEYDGTANPDMYPLPARDFEILYDREADTLTYRVRSDGADAWGAADNQADQRLISRLITDRVYVYTVDLTKYGPSNAAGHIVEIPYTVMRAFAERKIELRIALWNMTAAFPPGSLETAEVRALRGYGRGALFRVSASETPAASAALPPGEAYACPPQSLAITVETPSEKLALTRAAAPLRVTLRLSAAFRAAGSALAYFRDGNTAGWEAAKAEYDPAAGTLSFAAYKPGSFAAIAGKDRTAR